MKKLTMILLSCLLLGCISPSENQIAVNSKIGDSNKRFIDKTLKEFSLAKKEFQLTNSNTSEIGKSVNLYDELLALFDPDNFSCGCDDELKNKLKKLKPANKDKAGFIPADVTKNVYYADNVILLDKSGSSILAHGFQYKSGTAVSKLLFARNAPTVKNFNESDFIEKNPKTYNSFFYTVDCSGYLSAAISVAGGVGKNALKSSASAAQTKDKSLLVINGVMYSTLYQAFKGEGFFKGNSREVMTSRIETLLAIISEIPPLQRIPGTEIIINANYRIIITSDSGTSSFNGEAKLVANGGFSFGAGSVSAEGEGKGSVSRKSNFSSFKTYIIEENVGAVPQTITYTDLTTLISDLQSKIK
ncbi:MULTISPECIES: hypothetical protein [Sphingobacterium]|uniref:hypothetical protein n=1 Tax=Sphingobacterium TaxID=28453 RepID=UPI00257D2BB8|nr:MULTISPECIES: hypothetical protein [Sphingobacterium]